MKKIGELLIDHFGVSKTAVEVALKTQEQTKAPIGEILLKDGQVNEYGILRALGLQYVMQVKKNLPSNIQTIFAEHVPISFLKQHMIVPIITTAEQYFAVNNPFTFQALDDLRALLSLKTSKVVLAPSHQIINAINFVYDMTPTSADEVMQDIDDEDPERLFSEIEEVGDLLDDTSDSPVIRLVNLMFSQAVRDNASDIHIEPYQNSVKIRQRLDGILYDMLRPPKHVQSALISRVKIMAKLNIAEKRLP